MYLGTARRTDDLHERIFYQKQQRETHKLLQSTYQLTSYNKFFKTRLSPEVIYLRSLFQFDFNSLG